MSEQSMGASVIEVVGRGEQKYPYLSIRVNTAEGVKILDGYVDREIADWLLLMQQERERFREALEEIMAEYVPNSSKERNSLAMWRIAANAINPPDATDDSATA